MTGVLRWGATLLAVSLLVSFVDLGGEGTTKKTSASSSDFRIETPRRLQEEDGKMSSNFSYSSTSGPGPGLVYDFYRDTCPRVELVVKYAMRDLHLRNSTVAPALIRLLFHDCFVHGCDASVLLDRINGSVSEKDAIPNQTLRGFDAIEEIKSRVEAACHATVSCADILVIAAREALLLAGGPYYPVLTGRRDSTQSFYHDAQIQIPAPNDSYAKTLSNFATRGFNDKLTVALLGAHSIGKVHCRFFRDRLYDYDGTGQPDGSIDLDMVAEMRAVCGGGEEAGAETGYYRGWKEEMGFGSHYYWSLLGGRGIMRADQQLTAGRTVKWVREYSAPQDGERKFRDDFGRAMVKLSGLSPLTGSDGEIRTRCSMVLAS
ncbi:putative Peroxidase 48 [Typha latifolia]|uniref:putative Peroxidase 48 n=1 Tax=Typha latifolia TaxID=4733 RepID=UPI003C2AFE70